MNRNLQTFGQSCQSPIVGFGMLLISAFVLPLSAWGQSSLDEDSSWQIPDDATVVELLRAGLQEQGIAENVAAESVTKLGPMLDGDRIDAFIRVASAAVPALGKRADEVVSDHSSIGDDPFLGFTNVLRDQVRLWTGRSLVRQRLYDEALPLLEPLDTQDVIQPDALLFYRAVCYHSLLKKDEAIDDLTLLLENKDRIARRFSRTAELMLADIEPLKEDSLDEIARLMNDVSRRLDLGRSGQPVVDEEQQIIDKLNKLIEEMEEQQKQQQQQMQQAQSGGDGSQSKPMEDSQIAGGSGAGDVDRKKLGDRDGWGDLPPADRKETLQNISQDLPTHYREAIEAYFRKLATEKR